MSASPIRSNLPSFQFNSSEQEVSLKRKREPLERMPVSIPLPSELDLFPELQGRVKHPQELKKKNPDPEKTLEKLKAPIAVDGPESVVPTTVKNNPGRVSIAPVMTVQGNVCFTISAQGPKDKNEDTFDHGKMCVKQLNGKEAILPFFGVYDGHGGDGVSRFLKANLRTIVSEKLGRIDLSNPVQVKQALKASFLEATAQFIEQNPKRRDGSTCIIAVMIGRKLYVANAGDGRAILVKDEKPIQLSQDAVATDEPFKSSIEKRGLVAGYRYLVEGEKKPRISESYPVSDEDHKIIQVVSNVFIPIIVDGEQRGYAPASLMPARVIGDSAFKVSSRPKVSMQELPEGEELRASNMFLVLGSDGLWDTLDSVSAAKVASEAQKEGGTDEDQVVNMAKMLCVAAFQSGAYDNTTVTVVKLA